MPNFEVTVTLALHDEDADRAWETINDWIAAHHPAWIELIEVAEPIQIWIK